MSTTPHNMSTYHTTRGLSPTSRRLTPAQTTLLLGFALASIGADTLTVMGDGQNSMCMYKSPLAMAIGALFVVTSAGCVCCCVLVLIFASWLINRSEAWVTPRALLLIVSDLT